MKIKNNQYSVFFFLALLSCLCMYFNKHISSVIMTPFTILLSPLPSEKHMADNSARILELENMLAVKEEEIERLGEIFDNIEALKSVHNHEPEIIIEAGILLSRDSTDNRNSFIINKGSKDGVELMSLVTYKKYLLGIVYKLSAYSSIVIQVSDPKMKISVLIQLPDKNKKLKIYDRGLSIGQSKQSCKVKLIKWQSGREFAFEKIDEEWALTGKAITSGLEEMYAPGFAIGDVKVKKLENKNYSFSIFPISLKKVSNVLVSKVIK